MEEDIQKEPSEQYSEQPQEGSPKTSDNKLFSVLSYIGVLCLIPLLLKKDDSFVFFHAKQGLVLFIAEIINSFVVMIPILGWIAAPIIWIGLIILSIMGIINALGGKTAKLPLIGQFADSIKL